MTARVLTGRFALCISAALSLGALNPLRAEFPGARHVTLLHIADTHAQLETHPEYMPGEKPELQQMGGYARLKTAIDRERASAQGAVFLADGGDTFQGSGPAAWSKGEVVLGPLNALGLDMFVPGNWEVVYGPERFRELMAKIKAPVICYNFHDTRTNQRLFAPSLTLNRDGVRITFVGITDVTASKRQPPDEVRGLDTTRMDGLRDFVKHIRESEHPDLVVAVDHTGLSISRAIAREIPEFDVILSGHTHERTEQPILEGKVIVVEPGSMGSFLGRLDLTLGPNGGVSAHSFKLIPIRASEFIEDAGEKKTIDDALGPYRARASEVVGRTDVALLRYDVLETNADNLISDVVREGTGADVGFTNGFRFAPPIAAGPLTVGDLWQLLPLDSRIKVGWITGKQLRDYLEQELELVFAKNPWKLSGGWGPRASGMSVVFAARNAFGKRVQSLKVDGREIKDGDRITVAGCERDGEPLDLVCRIRGVKDVKVVSPSIHQTLLAYFKKHPVISPERDSRAVAPDLPRTVFSQDHVVSATASPAAKPQ